MAEAKWQWIPGYEGHYEASTTGQIRSVLRVVPHARMGTKTIPTRILRPATNNKGHLMVGLNLNTKRRPYLLHRLVAFAFLGPPPSVLHSYVCHRDGDPKNNCIENLYWGTPSQNNYDRVRHGKHPHASKTRCPRNHLLVVPNLKPSDLKDGRRGCLACARTQSYTRNHPDIDFLTLSNQHYAKIMAFEEEK